MKLEPDSPTRVAAKAEPAARTASRPASAWLGRLQLLTGVMVVIGASVLVAWGLGRYLRQSPRFAVKTVVVAGNHRRTPHQIVKRAGLALGKNIFSIDEAATAAAIEADSWIESATVTTDLPSSLRISVVEREARTLCALEGKLYLVDGKGNIFKELEEGDPSDLPVVTGLGQRDVASDREGVRLALGRVIDLVTELERAALAARYPIQEVHVGADRALRAVVGTDAILLELGLPPYRTKIAKAARVLGELAFRKVAADVLFLDNRAHPERVIARMRAIEPRRPR